MANGPEKGAYTPMRTRGLVDANPREDKPNKNKNTNRFNTFRIKYCIRCSIRWTKNILAYKYPVDHLGILTAERQLV